jgi:hypothetical protein
VKNEGSSAHRSQGAGFGGEEKKIDAEDFRDRPAPRPEVKVLVENDVR